MGRVALHGRENWQTESGPRGKSGTAEKDLIEALKRNLDPETYEVDAHPKDFKHLYENVELSSKTLSEIFNPDALAMKQSKALGWGITPDFAIRNKKTGKILFGEIKRQDGWVEGKSPSAGRGNAHERLCKLFTPGIIKKYREVSGIQDPSILPFWVVLEGDITRDPKRNREIAFWFDKYDKNYFMWRPQMSDAELVEHFNTYLKPYLD